MADQVRIAAIDADLAADRPAIISDQDAQYAYEIVKTVCTEVGPGLPGTPQERARAAILQRELEAHLGAGNVTLEEFTLAPGAFLGALRMGGVFTLLAALLSMATGRLPGVSPWLTAAAALAFSGVSLGLFIVEFLFSRECIDPIFPKRPSVNVVGRLLKPGTETVKRLLILSGHHDSAEESTWLRWLGYGFFIAAATGPLGLIAMLGLSLSQLLGLITGQASLVRVEALGWGLLAFPIGPSIIFALFISRRGKDGGTVPGAIDNLAASALAVALCRFLVKHPDCILPGTEVRFISFGGEEAGLRGSRRYVERHLNELNRLDARLLNFELVAHPEITILASDVNGAVPHSKVMVNSVVAAAERAGVPHRLKPASLGVGTDAAPFSRAGLKATTLLPFKMPQQFVAFYHQPSDQPEALTIEPLLNVLKLTLEWVLTGGE
jgi:hypothetical protein